MTVAEAVAAAKVNLSLHVTGWREDGYHLLDSLVVFADFGDRLSVTRSGEPRLDVTGPMAAGVPSDGTNLALQAAALMEETASITLEKHVPNAAGLGGGSADAAATLRALSALTGKPIPDGLMRLGADVPVCLVNRAARMRGTGDRVETLPGMPALNAVLVNPGIALATADVFAALKNRTNPPMPEALPERPEPAMLIDWLRDMRNDLETPATAVEPRIAQVLGAISVTSGCRLARMTGSGATCFGLYNDADHAGAAAGRLRETFPGWWVRETVLNPAPPGVS